MNMNSELIKLKIEAISRQKQELVEELRKDFFPLVKTIFEKLPETFRTIGWTQYSPYFNDGDECVFSVNASLDYGIRINQSCIEDEEETGFCEIDVYTLQKYVNNDGSYEDWISKYPEYELGENITSEIINQFSAMKEFSDLISSINEDILEDLFGNHVEVIITREGEVYTEEYEHD